MKNLDIAYKLTEKQQQHKSMSVECSFLGLTLYTYRGMLVTTYKSTQHYISDDHILHFHSCENLKSHNIKAAHQC